MLVLISVLVGVAALFGWASQRVLRLPNTIGTMLLTAVTSIALVLLAPQWPAPHHWALGILGQIDFERLILHGMLGLLLFAGAFLLDLKALVHQKLVVALLAVPATIFSALAVGGLTWTVAHLFRHPVPLIQCLLFGALISPTDPVAVLEMLGRVQAPSHLKAQLAGESLFNDGVGAVLFISLLEAARGAQLAPGHVALQILLTGGGGILLGICLAFPIALFMRSVNSASIDILLSLALALGGYVVAEHLGLSAPLETVATALTLRLLIQNLPDNEIAHHDLSDFWTILDEIQNAILFVLMGCGFLIVDFRHQGVALGLSEVLIVNLVRIAAVALVLTALRMLRTECRSSLSVLSWGGLRGGLSIALALSIPHEYTGGWIVTATYVLVVFSILVQGSTFGIFLRRTTQPQQPAI
ncbi:MAG TPA: cation:proton antiporter [Acidobacteriaceae bacterium]|nr:cation:proton antiporter [Acidobacteriaceae bacterium]